jgi:hypothetical protein
MWKAFFEAGGWGMYPTATFGFVLVAAGVLFVLRPERRFVPLVLSLALMTLGSGVLSGTVGIVNTLHYVARVPAGERFAVVVLGCAESLHNVVLALIVTVLTGLLSSLAALRAARAAAAGAGAR